MEAAINVQIPLVFMRIIIGEMKGKMKKSYNKTALLDGSYLDELF